MKTILGLTLSSLAFAANATLIDFSNETRPHLVNNGYTVGDVTFHGTRGNFLYIADFMRQSHGFAMASNDLAGIRMNFANTYNYLKLDFGNDEVGYGYLHNVGNLKIYRGNTLVGETNVAWNNNDIMDQSIEISGIDFTSAVFNFNMANGKVFTLGPVIDNIYYDNINNAEPPAIPEPAPLPLLGIGLAGAAYFRQKGQKKNSK